MELPLNKLMELTKQQRRGGVFWKVTLGIIFIFLVQILVTIPVTTIAKDGATLISELSILFINIPVILSMLAYSKIVEKRNTSSYGFTKKNLFKNYFFGLLIGFIFLLGIFVLNLITGSVTVSLNISETNWIFIIVGFFGFIFQGLMEEVVSRGFIMNSVASKYGAISGIIVNSLFFGIFHLLNKGVTIFAVVNILLAGIVFSILYYATENIFLVSGLHTIWNFMLGPVFGIEYSGIKPFSSILRTVGVEGHSFINGGSFGFEGGVATTLMIIILTTFSFYLLKKKLKNNNLKGEN